MKFETTAGLLLSGLRAVKPAIEPRSTIPILETVKFDGHKLAGTDLDMEIEVDVPATSAAGTACIAHRPLLNLVRHIPADDTVRIAAGKDGATISFTGGRYDLPALLADDFPVFKSDEAMPVEFDGEGLRKALGFVRSFMSSEETRYYLNGACLDGKVAVATDGHRMGVHPLGFDGGSLDRCIVPRKTVELLSTLGAAKSLAVKSKGFSKMVFGFDGLSVRTNTIDGTFPDWQRVVPKFLDEAAKVELDRAELLRALSRISCAARIGTATAASVAWGNGRTVLVGKSYLKEATAREHLCFSVAPEASGIICFDLRYMRGLLRLLACETVTLTVSDSGSPSLWRGDGEAYAVLMPMRGADADGDLAKATLAKWQEENRRAA